MSVKSTPLLVRRQRVPKSPEFAPLHKIPKKNPYKEARARDVVHSDQTRGSVTSTPAAESSTLPSTPQPTTTMPTTLPIRPMQRTPERVANVEKGLITLVCSFFAKPAVGHSLDVRNHPIVGTIKSNQIPPAVVAELKRRLEHLHLELTELEEFMAANESSYN